MNITEIRTWQSTISNFDFPVLDGTKKQKEWAKTIRENVQMKLPSCAVNFLAPKFALGVAARNADAGIDWSLVNWDAVLVEFQGLVEETLNRTSSEWFIESRYFLTFDDFVMEAVNRSIGETAAEEVEETAVEEAVAEVVVIEEFHTEAEIAQADKIRHSAKVAAFQGRPEMQEKNAEDLGYKLGLQGFAVDGLDWNSVVRFYEEVVNEVLKEKDVTWLLANRTSVATKNYFQKEAIKRAYRASQEAERVAA